MNKLLIKNATIINENKRSLKDIYIEGEYIKEINTHIDLDDEVETINAKGLLVIPGMIDDQVHFREPGLTHKGDISSKFKFIFFKNYIINIVIGLLLFFNFVIYNLNSYYTIDSLKHVFFILIGLHFIFQTKNYMSLIIKSEAKEFIYFILYLCAFKLAPWLWLYQDLYST